MLAILAGGGTEPPDDRITSSSLPKPTVSECPSGDDRMCGASFQVIKAIMKVIPKAYNKKK